MQPPLGCTAGLSPPPAGACTGAEHLKAAGLPALFTASLHRYRATPEPPGFAPQPQRVNYSWNATTPCVDPAATATVMSPAPVSPASFCYSNRVMMLSFTVATTAAVTTANGLPQPLGYFLRVERSQSCAKQRQAWNGGCVAWGGGCRTYVGHRQHRRKPVWIPACLGTFHAPTPGVCRPGEHESEHESAVYVQLRTSVCTARLIDYHSCCVLVLL
jgi:hypothetical protein